MTEEQVRTLADYIGRHSDEAYIFIQTRGGKRQMYTNAKPLEFGLLMKSALACAVKYYKGNGFAQKAIIRELKILKSAAEDLISQQPTPKNGACKSSC